MTDAPHIPVLKTETLDLLEPGPGKRFIDGTFGFGGHTGSMLEAGAEVLGLDLDGVAFSACEKLAEDQENLRCCRISFRDLDEAMKLNNWDQVDGVLLDLGVSSWQLDDPDKGFSYRSDGPLDLRFNQDQGQTAADLVAELSETELADLIYRWGEERGSRRIARTLVRAREEEPIETTARLRDLIEGMLPRGVKSAPVLSRVFQALRIAVNEELEALPEALEKLLSAIKPGGVFVVISYHSLEDRIVKKFIDREKRDCLCPPELPVCRCGHLALLKPLTRKAVKASASEEKTNPRSRSARLRAARIL
ncbi:MAG: 16S rRNA (cytosine(1402)-N(4))-methyltransferase RsmH [bacterium]|nr:16S rRNA (cytosine(1402)-N(4))-methyltransferase RsmH [bacterium]